MTCKMRIAAPLAACGFLLVSSILLLAQACTPQPVSVTREPETLHMVAADSFAPLIGDLVAAYEESRPWVRVTTEVLNTAVAETVLRDGRADLALLSWLGEPEDGGQLWTEGFARDSVAVIVHPASPLTETGLAQLREIFRGRMQEWEGTVLTVVSREDGSGTRAAFESTALEGEGTTLSAAVVSSSEAMLELVATTPGAIGYVSSLWLGPTQLANSTRLTGSTQLSSSTQAPRLDGGVRVLSVEGLLPTEQSVGDGSYPLWRQLYLASAGEPQGAARDFAQWLLQRSGMRDSATVAGP
ncbi:MAG: substrate-binding domain-containing protein [Anaerolineae bacterium]